MNQAAVLLLATGAAEAPPTRFVIEVYFRTGATDGSMWVLRRQVLAALTLAAFRQSADELVRLMGFTTHVALHVDLESAATSQLDSTPCPPGRKPS